MYQTNYPDAYQSNPYERNKQNIKEYLGHPITLVLAILFSASFLFSLINIFTSADSVNYMFRMSVSSAGGYYFGMIIGLGISGLITAGLWVCWAKSRSPQPSSSPSAGLTMLYVVSIILLVFVILLSVILLIALMAVGSAGSSLTDEIFGYGYSRIYGSMIGLLVVIFLVVIAILLLFVIGMLRFVGSLKKSPQNIQMVDKGSILFGVMSIIIAFFSLIALFGSFDQYGANALTILSTLVALVAYVCLAIAAFRYHSFAAAKNAELNGAAQPGYGAASGYDYNAQAGQAYGQNYYGQQPYQPNGYGQQPYQTYNYGQQSAPQDPYQQTTPVTPEPAPYQSPYDATAAAPPQEDAHQASTKYCPYCGAPNSTLNPACEKCGMNFPE